ncbi:NADH dehydrogenase [ubiquinone] 1 alpha subcomplex subunit 7 [Drosophila eugracilis]|uniref:NADH dehydrogenase [ubiquinone] 1 alpha subcomplex subunit 7 n=1 Tax=Drosophila eugracilis TaxID=29029 RepID=UPI0007E83B40|nr:NADH dehydrogenase [ubiquinone] 1 alpha subcomplex subunit 7 [Drosophila eugracilis]XP_017064686.1 NADH dehydrogenase [ubiquinone] 1 alpha subcomplex subunit 7 [Drosophila eugracilis]
MSALRRDVSPILQRIRAFLLGREHNLALRFEDGLADRTQPQPNIPDGPSHLASANYYCQRDARREVFPPIDLVEQQKQLAAETAEAAKVVSSKLPTPGKVYAWD